MSDEKNIESASSLLIYFFHPTFYQLNINQMEFTARWPRWTVKGLRVRRTGKDGYGAEGETFRRPATGEP